jgi:BirA family biotin operon repressor/biotin-[acetyl-CoA-carboxylase] ligase
MLFTQLIQANLTTQILGRTIEHYAVTDSTNSDALELASEGAPEGTVVTTDNQTAGRGRHGRSWFCGVGKGLAFSVILRPETDGKSAGLLPLLAGVAVAEVLEQFNLQAALKWPNDILLNKKKCGGILTEGKFQGNLLSSTVIGIGINVNESADELPEDLRQTATSLAEESGTTVQRELMLARILNSLEPWYRRLQSGATAEIISAWEGYCAHLQKSVSFFRENQEMTGIFSGVAEGGEAIIENGDDRLLLSSEEISMLREE